MIQIHLAYDWDDKLPANFDDAIEALLKPHAQDLECEGSGTSFFTTPARRDIEFWCTAFDPDISIEFALEPLFLNTRNLDVLVIEDEEDEDDDS